MKQAHFWTEPKVGLKMSVRNCGKHLEKWLF